MKYLLAFDKFKDCMSSSVANSIAAAVISKRAHNQVQVQTISDGGEGFLKLLEEHFKAQRFQLKVSDPLGRPIDTSYLIFEFDGVYFEKPKRKVKIAAIELSKQSGLWLLSPSERNVWKTNSYGTGEVMKHALKEGVEGFLIGLGGSATHDLGLGALCALDNLEACHRLTPENPSFKIINRTQLPPIVFVTDVQAPLLGKYGASCTFSRQKGNSEEGIRALEEQSIAWESQLNQFSDNAAFKDKLGLGAAGGFSYSFHHFTSCRLLSSSQFLKETLKIEEAILDVDIVFTGEGRFDASSLMGKAPYTLIELCKKHKKHCVVLCGSIEEGIRESLEGPLVHFFEIRDESLDLTQNLHMAPQILSIYVDEIIKNSKFP
jgi:glycerate kinase